MNVPGCMWLRQIKRGSIDGSVCLAAEGAGDRFEFWQNFKDGIFFCLKSGLLGEQTGIGHDLEM